MAVIGEVVFVIVAVVVVVVDVDVVVVLGALQPHVEGFGVGLDLLQWVGFW